MFARRRFIAMGLFSLIHSWFPVSASDVDSAKASEAGNSPRSAHSGGRILVIGDSLSAEYGIPQGTGWITHITRRLDEHNTGYQIHNSSISGDTTSGGVSRLPAELEQYQPDIVILELGSNDALRGLPLEMTRDNLAKMIQWCHDIDAQVVLIGMQIPPNYGKRYADQFAGIFPELASSYSTSLVPFMLEGFATRPDMFLDDAIHPNQAAQPLIAETIWTHLAPLVLTTQEAD